MYGVKRETTGLMCWHVRRRQLVTKGSSSRRVYMYILEELTITSTSAIRVWRGSGACARHFQHLVSVDLPWTSQKAQFRRLSCRDRWARSFSINVGHGNRIGSWRWPEREWALASIEQPPTRQCTSVQPGVCTGGLGQEIEAQKGVFELGSLPKRYKVWLTRHMSPVKSIVDCRG